MVAGSFAEVADASWTPLEGRLARAAVGCATAVASSGNCAAGAFAAAFSPDPTKMPLQETSLGTADPVAYLKLAAHIGEESLVRQELARIAAKNGLSLLELDGALVGLSVIGEQINDGRLHELPDGGVVINGVLTRNWYASPFDVIDIVLAYQGLPTGAFLRYAFYYSDVPIEVAHSLGSLDASNLVGYGIASEAQLYAAPLGMIVPTGFGNVTIENNYRDVIAGGVFGKLFNPDATYIDGPSSPFGHSLCKTYGQLCPQ